MQETTLRHYCPWCGRKFEITRHVEEHEAKCPRWGLRPDEETDDEVEAGEST